MFGTVSLLIWKYFQFKFKSRNTGKFCSLAIHLTRLNPKPIKINTDLCLTSFACSLSLSFFLSFHHSLLVIYNVNCLLNVQRQSNNSINNNRRLNQNKSGSKVDVHIDQTVSAYFIISVIAKTHTTHFFCNLHLQKKSLRLFHSS